jgi:hypothetical protein
MKVIFYDVSLTDYLNNSGTRGAQPLYATSGVTVSRFRYKLLGDGTYKRIKEANTKIIILNN